MDKVIVQELIFREDGSVCGLGNSHLVDEADAKELVGSGKYKFENVPLGEKAKKVKKKKKDAGAIENGGN